MTDREKLLTAMECIKGRANFSVVEAQCRECPYNAPILESGCDTWTMIDDALALLKEQEEALKHLRIKLNLANGTAKQTEKIEKDIGWEDIGWLTEGL